MIFKNIIDMNKSVFYTTLSLQKSYFKWLERTVLYPLDRIEEGL